MKIELPKTNKPTRDRTGYYAIALLVLGLAQMAAALTGLGPVQGLAAATVASPAPKVFSVAGGLETYSTHFFLEWTTRDGRAESLALTPEVYPLLQGPYNRRNVYGAILAFGPVLYSDARSRPMFDATATYALCGPAPILVELGIDPADVASDLRVRYVPREDIDISPLPTLIEIRCP